MIVSEARIAANRLNAARSTGPRTAEGKEVSRANALTHGMCAAVLTVAETEPGPMAEARRAAWRDVLKPRGDAEDWLVAEIAATTLRIDHAERVDRQARDKAALRAEVCWDDDRRLAAETLGAGLSKSPAEVVGRLKATPQGADWLIKRWGLLLQVSDRRRPWSAAQKSVAFDLLGTPAAFRDDRPTPGPGPDGKTESEARFRSEADLARDEIAALIAHRDRVAELDRVDRGLAGADLVDADSAEIRRLRRYEASLHKRLRWCLEQLQAGPRDEGPTIESPPASEARIEPATGPDTEPDIEPEAEIEPAPAPEPEPNSIRPELPPVVVEPPAGGGPVPPGRVPS